MNKTWSSLMVTGFVLVLSVGSAQAAERQVKQQKRIGQGVRSGELTRPEVRRLERNAARINRSIKRDRRDGGIFTPRERIKAQQRLNRQSRAIYRQKHDKQGRY